MNTFSVILKQHKYKTDVSVNKTIKSSHLEIQNVFTSAEYLWLKNSQKFKLCETVLNKIGFFTIKIFHPNC